MKIQRRLGNYHRTNYRYSNSITKRSAIKSILTARILVGFVLAIRFTVAEELLVDTLAVTTR